MKRKRKKTPRLIVTTAWGESKRTSDVRFLGFWFDTGLVFRLSPTSQGEIGRRAYGEREGGVRQQKSGGLTWNIARDSATISRDTIKRPSIRAYFERSFGWISCKCRGAKQMTDILQ